MSPSKQPAARPAHRVPRSPADNYYVKGPPPPPTRLGSGEVTAIEDADSVTVLMNDEEVEGVHVQGDMPEVGDQLDVWTMNELVYTPGPGGTGADGDVGPAGPAGPPGIVRVDHGATAGTARPHVGDPPVLWVGTVTPTNADTARDFGAGF